MPDRVLASLQASILFHPHWWRWRALPPRPTALPLDRITVISLRDGLILRFRSSGVFSHCLRSSRIRQRRAESCVPFRANFAFNRSSPLRRSHPFRCGWSTRLTSIHLVAVAIQRQRISSGDCEHRHSIKRVIRTFFCSIKASWLPPALYAFIACTIVIAKSATGCFRETPGCCTPWRRARPTASAPRPARRRECGNRACL